MQIGANSTKVGAKRSLAEINSPHLNAALFTKKDTDRDSHSELVDESKSVGKSVEVSRPPPIEIHEKEIIKVEGPMTKPGDDPRIRLMTPHKALEECYMCKTFMLFDVTKLVAHLV